MTADAEAARKVLWKLNDLLRCVIPDDVAWHEVNKHLADLSAALNGEPREEVWETGGQCGQFNPIRDGVFVVDRFNYPDNSGVPVAVVRNTKIARRIARLPALERAAMDIVRDYDGMAVFPDQVRALRAALTPPEAQP